jgi:hypothetical protein
VWRVKVRGKGAGILPPFPAERAFDILLRVGSNVFLSESAELYESATGTSRRFP